MVANFTLDVDSIRAFVVIADSQSFTRAAQFLGTTQGALSVKLKRLEDKLGHRLIERTPRHVRLSTKGELFIDSARDFLAAHERALANLATQRKHLKLGMACHVMGPEITTLLARLKSMDPGLSIEVRLDSVGPLLDDYDAGVLDAVIIRDCEDRRDGNVLCVETFGWFAAADFEFNRDEPLRVASLSPQCGVRDLAAMSLDRATIPWIEVFVGGGVSAVIAAISAGLAVGVLPCRLAPAELVEVSQRFDLPGLPSSKLVMHSKLSDTRTRESLRVIASAFREPRSQARSGPGVLDEL
ncbi:LysR family transcriptional regulator [Pseudomonas piscis]|uniref:LysR family transcriptional regulator n=1 Tax=Pseudomonas piscis TaxID=2614538 RepID=UPI00384A567F